MTPLHRSLLSTLALADVEGKPFLTLQEIAAYLHKTDAEKEKAHAPTLLEIAQELSSLAAKGSIVQRDGQFGLKGKSGHAARKDFSEEKMRKAGRALSYLSAVPFVRALAVTGSASFGNARESSDLDILMLTKKNRLWTARLFSLAILELFGRRRDAQGASRKICLNYLLAEDAKPPVQNIASAHMFKRAIPVFGASVFTDFMGRNGWMRSFFYHSAPRPMHETGHKPARLFSLARLCMEFLLAGFIGSFVEYMARTWQEKRLHRKKQEVGDSPHFFFSADVIMLHHPDPKNKKIMERYHSIMARINL